MSEVPGPISQDNKTQYSLSLALGYSENRRDKKSLFVSDFENLTNLGDLAVLILPIFQKLKG